jgi:outer membrane protein assembly factor BamA
MTKTQVLSLILFGLLSSKALYSAQATESQNGGPKAATGTREEEWRSMREHRAKTLVPYRQRGLERGILWVEKDGLRLVQINIKGFQPKIGGLPTGSGFALGTTYRLPDPERRFPDLESSATWSFRGYQAYDLQFGDLHPRPRRAAVYLDVGYLNFPQEDFFGIGPDSKTRDRTDFRLEQAAFDGVAEYRFTSWLRTSLRAGYLKVNTGRGTDDRFPDTRTRFSEVSAPGISVQPDFLRLNYALVADYRDSPGNPHTGGSVSAAFSRYDERSGGRFTFNRFEVEADHYIPLGSTVRLLALRFLTSFSEPDGGNTVPFYLLQTLGGGDSLRGFREYRFRDRNLLYLSGEYRWEPVRAVELALFYDAGKVFSRRSDFDFEGLRKSAGFGVRFKTPGSVVLRIDAARSGEGNRLYFKFGPSF